MFLLFILYFLIFPDTSFKESPLLYTFEVFFILIFGLIPLGGLIEYTLIYFKKK